MGSALIVAVVGGLVAAALAAMRFARRGGDGPELRVGEVPRAIAELAGQGGEHAFLGLMWEPSDRPGAAALDLQLSIDQGRLGLDWVLLSPTNQADRPRVEAFLRQRGCAWREREVRGVRFLRVEDGDLAALASAILTELYGLAPEATVATVVEGFGLRLGR